MINRWLKQAINRTLKIVAKAPVRISLAMALTAMILGGTLFSLFEPNASFWDGIYWTWVVMPTVGFGDFSPETALGRCVYIYVVASGWVITILMGGAVVDAIREHTIERQHEKTAEIDDDLAVLKFQAQELCSGLERLAEIVDNDHMREAARVAHEERMGNA